MKILLLFFLIVIPSAVWSAEIVINAVGDIMIGGSATRTLERRGFAYPFAATGSALREGDIAIGNLEAPITRRGTEFTGKKFRFKSDPKTAAALKESGFSVVTLANNHILDFGPEGLAQTRDHLQRAGIAHAGAGPDLASARAPAVVSVKGKKVAFLAYSLTLPAEFYATPSRAGTAPGYLRFVKADVEKARGTSDHVVVSFHWGKELAELPQPYQVATARAAIDAGADVVLGHHPHVLQGVERYKNGIIFYSLGNFAFATPSTRSDTSVIARIALDGGVTRVELLPLNVLNREVRLQPALLAGQRGKKVIDRLNRISVGMGTTIVSEGSRYVVDWERPKRVATR